MSEDNQGEDKKPLRRSTRATRGSVKPVVDLDEKLDLSEDEAKKVPKQVKSKSKKKESVSKVKEEVIELSDDEDQDDDVESVEVFDLSDDGKDEDFEVSKPKRASKGSRQSTVSRKQPNIKETKPSKKSVASKKATDLSDPPKTAPKATKSKGKAKSVKEEPESGDDLNSIDTFYVLSEKEMKEINNAFDLNCSQDGNELLESDDLKTAIRSLGFEPRADEIQRLLKKYSNNDGKVNRANFHKIMSFKMGTSLGLKDGSTNDEITRVFNLLDLDKTGLISLENLKFIAQDLNEEITDEELHEMIAEADMDGDQMINKQEFYHIMKKTSLY